MRILIVGKYPPIEGGVSSHTYWLARGLGEAGHEVSVVTNADRVEDMYRARIDMSDHETQHEYQPKGVKVFSLQHEPPMHIPFSEGYVTRLTNMGLRVIAERGADVIYAHYLEPYAVAAYMLKHFTRLPIVVRNAGSDIHRLLRDKDYSLVLGRVLTRADALLVTRNLRNFIQTLGVPRRRLGMLPNRALHPMFSPDGDTFDVSPYFAPESKGPLITYLGKAATNKGIMETLDALSQYKGDFRLLFVAQGKMLQQMKDRVINDPALVGRVGFCSFVAPWVVPSILRATDIMLHLENRFPVPIHGPTQPYEAIASGTPLLMSNEMYKKIQAAFPQTHQRLSVVADPEDLPSFKVALEEALSNPTKMRENARAVREEFLPNNDWDRHVDVHVRIFEGVRNPGPISSLVHFLRWIVRGGGPAARDR